MSDDQVDDRLSIHEAKVLRMLADRVGRSARSGSVKQLATEPIVARHLVRIATSADVLATWCSAFIASEAAATGGAA